MVVKANEIINKIVKKNVANYQKAIENIDRIIEKEFDGQKVKIWDSRIGELTTSLKTALFMRYSEAGWKIKEKTTYNERDGHETYYIFTPKRPREYNSV